MEGEGSGVTTSKKLKGLLVWATDRVPSTGAVTQPRGPATRGHDGEILLLM